MNMPNVRVFDADFLDRLTAEAAATPRRRKNFNLHASDDYPEKCIWA